MERVLIKSKEHIIGYHTQEFRYEGALDEAIPCHQTDAWLGVGYYFWVGLDFAHYWGEDFKMKSSPTGKYDIYKAHIEEEDLLNTVFNQKHYIFFIDKIESTIEMLRKNGVASISLNKVNRFLTDKVWKNAGIKGIIFEDIPMNKSEKGRTYSTIPPLYYLKRIQIVAFDKKIINNFEVILEEQP